MNLSSPVPERRNYLTMSVSPYRASVTFVTPKYAENCEATATFT